MKRPLIGIAAFAVLSHVVWAGVAVEMELDATDAPERSGTETFYAQGEMTRTDLSSSGKHSSVIFRDQTMYFVDHGKKVCQEISKKDVDQLSDQLGAVMKELDKLPPDQRAMMEKMMKGKMPGAKKPPTFRVEVGQPDQVGEFPCTNHTLYSDDEKVQEVCMADASVAADIAEAMDSIHALARFAEGLMEVARNLPFGNALEIPFQELHELDGFPVRTRFFDGEGNLVSVKTLKSVTRLEIEPEMFEIPKGYKVKSLGKELQKSVKM